MSSPTTTPCGITDIVYLPHGTMPLDLTVTDLPVGASDINKFCHHIGQLVASNSDVDHIVLLTPHGLAVDHNLGVYNPGSMRCVATGNALWCGGWQEYEVEVELDGQLSQDLFQHLTQTASTNASMPSVCPIRSYGGLSAPLRWGEVVPFHFLLSHHKHAQLSTGNKHIKLQRQHSSIAILSVPRYMYTCPVEEINLFRSKHKTMNGAVGVSIDEWAKQQGKRVMLVVSGDQSHVHQSPAGLRAAYVPDPASHFEANAALARAFDEEWMKWADAIAAHDMAKADQHVNVALQTDVDAKCCGLSGLLTIHGVIQASSEKWKMLASGYAAPTYYGMAAFYFKRQ